MAAAPKLPASVDDTLAMLGSADYVADRSLATAVHLALHLKRPLFLEGEAGVGKTEIAKVLATALGRRLIRLQCYEGLDVASAVYEWDYARQMIEIRLAEAAEEDRAEIESTIFSDRFLIKRPLLQALEPELAGAPVLLIDELDRTDEPFEAYLLELLSDFQVTIPEIGTIKAEQPPIVVITSNRTREIHDALKRRCFYYWVDYPNAARELEILQRKAPGAGERPVARGRRLRPEVAHDGFVQAAGHRRDDRLDRGVDAARRARTDPARDQRHAGRTAQIPGRHRPAAGQRGRAAARAGQGRSRCRGRVMAATQTGGSLLANLMHFARTLRAAGLPVGPGKVIDAVAAVRAVGITDRRDFYWTLHAVFVNRPDQRLIFDQAFHVFWRNPDLLEEDDGAGAAGNSSRSPRRIEARRWRGAWPRRCTRTSSRRPASPRRPRSSSTRP